MSQPQVIPITFFTKPGCHLCEDVAEHLETLALRYPIEVTALSILDDLDLHRRYWDKIPVLIIGEQTLQAPIGAAELAAAVARAGRNT